MAAITAAAMSAAAAHYQMEAAMKSMGLKPVKRPDPETWNLYREMERHRIKMEEMHAQTMKEAKQATYLLGALVFAIPNAIFGWTDQLLSYLLGVL
jgi:hypothetical protein